MPMEIGQNIFRFTIKELQPGGKSSAAIVRNAQRIGLKKVCAVHESDMYFVRGNIAPGELDLLGRFLFSDPVLTTFSVEQLPSKPEPNAQYIEVGFHVGVTDSVAEEIVRAARELGITGIDAAATGKRYTVLCSDNLLLENIELARLAEKVLVNPVVQRYAIGPMMPAFPEESAPRIPVELFNIHEMNDEELSALNLRQRSALSMEELHVIRDYFRAQKRPCSDAEYEMIAQTWSEHCIHKTFKANIRVEGGKADGLPQVVDNILLTYIKSATDAISASWVVSAFKDNAGILAFDDEHEISFKVETHNHPSAIEPFGGANTGVGGVIRDILGVSAKPIAVTDVLCFGLDDSTDFSLGNQSLQTLHIQDGVIAGVQDYGNKMGIPTVNGGIHYHEKYVSNPLVYCGCAGIAPKGSHPSAQKIGDRIFVIGGKTGRDGIRGATFSSMTMNNATFEHAGSSVQIGAPLIEKKVSEIILSARDKKLYSAITDCGAGGLSSAVGEMTSELGGEIEIAKVPLKYAGLAPWEIWLSEAQERMVLVIPTENTAEFIALCELNDVEYCDIGYFSGSGKLIVRYFGDVIIDLDCSFLHKGIPQRHLVARPAIQTSVNAEAEILKKSLLEQAYRSIGNIFFANLLMGVLKHHAVHAKEHAIRFYDHEVQGATVVGPFAGYSQTGPSDAAVLAPAEVKNGKGIVISNGFNPRYGEADSYNAAFSAFDEAVRNAVACGADPDRIAVIDNFCWGDPNNPENMYTLLRSAQACQEAALIHHSPFVSGKDSFNNEFIDKEGKRRAIPPSLLISAIGLIPDVHKAVTANLKDAGNSIYLVGEFSPVLSASVAAQLLDAHFSQHHADGQTKLDFFRGTGPAPSRKAPQIYRALHRAMQNSLIASCHDISDGGLLTTISEMCIAGERGASISLEKLTISASAWDVVLTLFGETNGSLVVEVKPETEDKFLKEMSRNECMKIGIVEKSRQNLDLKITGHTPLSFSLDAMKTAFHVQSIAGGVR